MKFSKFGSLFLTIILVAVLSTSCGEYIAIAAEKSNEPINLILAHSATPGNSLSIAYDKFAELVAEKSDGRLIVKVYGSGILAGDQTAVDGVKMGTIDIGSCASNNISGYTNAFLFADFPYIFDSIESSHRVWWGDIGEEAKQKAEKDIGAKVLFYLDTGGGFRLLANNLKTVKTPDDLKGMKLRSTATPIEIALLKAWGAAPTPVPWPEVYTALEQKVVVGEHLQPVWLFEAKHYEALQYLTEVNAMANVHIALMSHKAWDNLSPQFQQVIMEAGVETQEFGAQVDAAKGQESLQHLLNAGLELYKPTEEEALLWERLGKSIWPQFYDQVPEELVNRIIEVQK